MAKKKLTTEKLKERCNILEKVIVALSVPYHDSQITDDQQKFIETILGAAIWYLPHTEKYWTGRISDGLLDELKKLRKPKFTKEHQFPRKIAAKELLKEPNQFSRMETSMLRLYEEKYAKFNLVTPQENKKISKHQRDGVFKDIDQAYQAAGIKLITVSADELKNLRKSRKQ